MFGNVLVVGHLLKEPRLMDSPEKALRMFKEYLNYSGPNSNDRTFWDQKILVPSYMERLQEETS